MFTVVEAGAGPGTLARVDPRRPRPRCARGAALRARRACRTPSGALHAEHLALEPPAFAFASPPDPDDEDEPPVATGPIVVSLDDAAARARAVRRPRQRAARQPPVRPARADRRRAGRRCASASTADALVEVLVPDRRPPALDAPVGARVPTSRRPPRLGARRRRARRARRARRRRSTTRRRPASWPSGRGPEWVRTYRRPRARRPSARAASASRTSPARSPSTSCPPPARDVTQAEWLRAHGIDELVEEGRAIWQERAAIGDLEAIRARSRVTEAEALLDPAGLGAFRVLEWDGAEALLGEHAAARLVGVLRRRGRRRRRGSPRAGSR